MKLKKAAAWVLAALCCFCCAACKTPSKQEEGGKINMEDFPFYKDAEEAAYDFTGRDPKKGWKENRKLYTPYWKGNIIYQETVMCIDDGEKIQGKLQYNPVKILSVRDYTFEKEYVSGKDYTVEGNTIILPEGSECPYLTEENLQLENLPSPYRKVQGIVNTDTDIVKMGDGVFWTEGSFVYGRQICVSYVYDVADVKTEQFATFGTVAPNFLEKLEAGADVKISIIGDSVAEGCSSSSQFHHEPYMPNYIKLVSDGLAYEYGINTALENIAKGGETSAYAANATQISRAISTNADIMFLHFGINDNGGVSANLFEENIETFITEVHEACPDMEFVFIKASMTNPMGYDALKFEQFWQRMDRLAKSYEYFYTLDMYTPSAQMLKVKKYMDITGNGINHLNDYMTRLYAMNIMSAFAKFDK